MKWSYRIRYNATILAMLLIVLLVVGLTVGCASEPLTKKQLSTISSECLYDPACMVAKQNALILDLEYEREDKREIKRDAVVALINWCRAGGNIMLYNKINWADLKNIERAIRRNGYVTTADVPRNPWPSDYQCVTRRAAQQILPGRF